MSETKVDHVGVGVYVHKGTSPNHYKLSVDLTIGGARGQDFTDGAIDPEEIRYSLLTNENTEAAYDGNGDGQRSKEHGHFSLTDRGVTQLKASHGYKSNLLLLRTDALASAEIVIFVKGVEGRYSVDLVGAAPLVEDEASW